MAYPESHPDRPELPRQRAETRIGAGDAAPWEALPPEQAQGTLPELRACQVELELQKEELRRTQVDLEASRERYFSLFDQAPVGYLTLGGDGSILEANFAAARALGVTHGGLLGQPFARFVLPEDLEPFHRHFDQLGAAGGARRLDLRLCGAEATVTWARLEAVAGLDAGGTLEWRVVLATIDEAKRAERDLQDMQHRHRALLEIYEHAGESEEELIARILEHAVALSGSEVGYLHFVDEDQQHLQLVAWSTGARTLCQTVTDKHYPLDLAGIWADCVRSRGAVVHNDYLAAPGRRGLPEGHFPVRRHMSVPVFEDERIAAVLGVGNKATDYDLSDSNRLEILANTLWQLAGRKRTESALERSEALLRKANEELEERIRSRTWELQRVVLRLEESERKFRTVADFTYDWEYWLDPDGSFRYVSPSCERVSGYPPEAFLADPGLFHRIIHAEDRPRLEEHFLAQGRQPEGEELAFRIVHRSGAERWIGHTCQPVFAEDGAWLGQRGSNRDITAQKRADEKLREIRDSLEIQRDLHSALRESNEKLLRSQDRQPLCHTLCETAVGTGRFELAWVGTLEADGGVGVYAAAGAAAAYLDDIRVTTDAARPSGRGPVGTCIRTVRTRVSQAFASDPGLAPWHRLGASHRLASMAAFPIQENGRCIGALALYSSVPGFFTAERVALLEQLTANLSRTLDQWGLAAREAAAEEAIRLSEAKFRALAASATIQIHTLDAQGRITFMNQACLDFHGLASQEEAHRFDWRSSIHPEDLAQRAPWQVAPDQPGPWQEWEYRCLNARGEYRWLLARAVPDFGPRGAFGGLIGNAIDITERLLQESRAREMEAANGKSRIAAYLAHEINNPLMAINNSFRLIADHTPADHPDHPFVGIIRKELDRIAGIVRTAYSLHRPGLPQVKDAVVREILADLQALLQSKLKDHAVTLEVEGADQGLRGRLHEDLLRQVLFNVFQNAMVASPPGSRILCRCGEEGGSLVLDVVDRGPGIPGPLADRIFEPGFTTKVGLETGGLGLGLSTCRTLLESVGGSIGYRPADPAPGACFRIRIPWQE